MHGHLHSLEPWTRRRSHTSFVAAALSSAMHFTLLLIVVHTTTAAASAAATASRVLITPVTTAAPAPTPAPAEAPCDAIAAAARDEELPELQPCSCYSNLPGACTRLMRRGEAAHAKMEDCGARVGTTVIAPDSCEGGYYGHDSLDPAVVLENGLSARGSDWDLIRHAEQAGDSAFRGTTKLVTFPDGGGAAAWADEGGFVYEITCVPSWDVNKHVQGRRMVSDLAVGAARYGGNLALGEHEHAIPARVPSEHIKRYGAVVASSSGVPFVPRSSWVENPRWDPCFCRYSLSECDDATPCH